MAVFEPLREVIARAIYEDPAEWNSWDDVSTERRVKWLEDADRVITAMIGMAHAFAEHALEDGGVDWLANTPMDLWRDFLRSELKKRNVDAA